MTLLPWLFALLILLVGSLWQVRKGVRRQEPVGLVLATLGLSLAFASLAFLAERYFQVHGGQRGTHRGGDAVVGLAWRLLVLAVVGESAKALAVLPAYRSRLAGGRFAGGVYAESAALGFAAVQSVFVAATTEAGGLAVVRLAFGLQAHVLFARIWGTALSGPPRKGMGRAFLGAWLLAVMGHGVYDHILFGRGPGALVLAIPLAVAMGAVAWVAGREHSLWEGDAFQSGAGAASVTGMALESLRAPPSLGEFRQWLQHSRRPLLVRWVLLGALVTLGAMVVGLAVVVRLAWLWHIDFSLVDERDIVSMAPVALLGSGILFAFPVSGFVVARASGVSTLVEPVLAAAVAILATLALLSLAAPMAALFAAAFAPVAWGLAYLGAWLGRSPFR